MADASNPVPDEQPAEQPVDETTTTPSIPLTFLLVSGRRRTMSFEPDNTIGRVKELLWNTWPSDWQNERPPAPSYLRVLHLGKILQDEETLSSLKLATAPAPPTIVHLSVRQHPITAGSDALKKGSDDDSQVGGCCGCIIS